MTEPLQRLLTSYEREYTSRSKKSREIFERARQHLPGGVSGNMKLMLPYPHPLYFEAARGARVYDVDGNEYIDTIFGAGTQILGHCHPAVVNAIKNQLSHSLTIIYPTELELRLSEKIQQHCPHMELLRFTNTGSEAATMALRTARAYTGRNMIAKFEGNWHGQHDLTLVSCTSPPQGDEQKPEAVLDSPGLPNDILSSVLVLPFNNTDATCKLIKEHSSELGAVIIEPVCVFQCGVVPAQREFLRALREVTQQHDIPLIFDEVITGFRLGFGGATEFLGVEPDLCLLGKIIGGGMPIGAFGGRRDMMEKVVSPLAQGSRAGAKILHSGSFTANPVSLAAGLATLEELERLNPYPYMERMTQEYKEKVSRLAMELELKIQINALGSFYQLLFTDGPVRNKRDAMKADKLKQQLFSIGMTVNGIVMIPAHPCLMSSAHSPDDVKSMTEASGRVLAQLASSERQERQTSVRTAQSR